uniref:Pseudouridine synthase RsuA/RluA-like domain-containing protein n=1 Tax=Zea mays TaxID=4577 RepID=A0A804MTQ6_MAIZE
QNRTNPCSSSRRRRRRGTPGCRSQWPPSSPYVRSYGTATSVALPSSPAPAASPPPLLSSHAAAPYSPVPLPLTSPRCQPLPPPPPPHQPHRTQCTIGFCRAPCRTTLRESSTSWLGRTRWQPISSPGRSACLLYLIEFGAVYYALVAPQPPPYASPEHFRLFREVTEPSVLRRRASIKGKTVREAQKTFRVTDPNQRLEAGTYLRVHVHPKRFPRCYQIDWKSRVIAVADEYVVLDKPAATSVGGATDNIEESCAVFTSRALGLETPLLTTHQIDNCSEGCVVLSKTKEFCSVFHGLIREKQVKKLYLALTTAPVSTGTITHYMRPVNRAPRLVSEDCIERWHLCQMEVLDCSKVPWPSSSIRKAYNVNGCGWPQQEAAYECKINLLTGKTHQIRAQLAAIGAPIIGDSAYMTAAMAAMANPSINPFGRERLSYNSEEEKEAAVEAWIASHGKEPKSVIGLQASEISWDHEGKHHSYKAGVPWWWQDPDS